MPDDRSRVFGDLLKQHRLDASLSQEELAERAHLSSHTISGLERGIRRAPYSHTVEVLADALGLSPPDRTELHSVAERARRRSPSTRLAPETDTVGPPNNLPRQLSSFVGREKDVAKIRELIASDRLVTLVGSGGVGKTRIALRVAADLLDGSGQGVWFVDLAPLTDASLVPSTIASALSVQETLDRPILQTLIAYLKNRYLLLVLDNCEHLIDGVARAAEVLLQSCSRLQILATSREALGISGERTYRVPSLSVPALDEMHRLTVDEALGYDAVALFAVRAEAADGRFELTQQLVPTVAEICRRLDGIALAIELAAARVSVLSATTLAQRLNERFLVLTGGSRTALPRHKTMRALLDWSYDLLEAREQDLFRKLSIFAGGFTLDLAVALCANDGAIAEVEVLDLIASLVGKSLVVSETAAEETMRYRLLESTRHYALEKLHESGEYATVAQAHALVMLALAERFDSTFELLADRIWAARVKPEIENWRAALTWAFGSLGDPSIGQRLAGSLFDVWRYQSVEGRHWVREALRTCGDATPPIVRAKLELTAARNAVVLGENKTLLAAAGTALRLYRRADDPLGTAEAQGCLALGLINEGRVAEGESLVRAVLALAQAGGAERLIAWATHVLGVARYVDDDLGAARSLFREALTLYKTAGCERIAAKLGHNLAELEFQAGDIETALQLGREAAEALRTSNLWDSLAGSLCNLSAYLTALARFEEARGCASEALSLAREAGFGLHAAWALLHLAAIAALRAGDNSADRLVNLRRAASILGYVDARFAELGYKPQYTEQQEYDKILPVLRSELGADLDAFLDEGKQWSDDRAVMEALEIDAVDLDRPSRSLG
jgi:predicted ATPase/DNA-binding XRE family transcriptional regulator/tetratricopeptide (TPR) repeat protein